MDIHNFNLETWQVVLISLGLLWELAWKGIALWRAAHKNQLVWFTALLILNTVGILPIIYLLISKADEQTDTV